MFELILGLTLMGALLIFVELFIPGMVAGICGAIALLAAIVLSYANYGAEKGNAMLAVVLLASVVFFAWWMRAFFQSRLGRRWTLQETVPQDPNPQRFSGLENQLGRALTSLRPAGTALVDGRRIDVIAESGLIEAGEPVRVVRVEGPKVVVRKT